ncbi:MAG: cytochrome c-type biogenesis CcmF C-terminal domain-containing protein, partial [Gemmatimonadaceae bacterium]
GRLTSQGVSQYNELNRSVVAAAVELARTERSVGIVTSESRQYLDSRGAPTFEPATTAGITGAFGQDVYVTLAGVGDGEAVRLRVAFNPVVRWVWIAGVVLSIGGVLLLFETAPRREE